MGSVLERLAAREQAALARIEELRERIAALTAELGEAERAAERLRIGREVLAEVLAGDDGPVVAAPAAVSTAPSKRDGRRWQTVPHRADDPDLESLPLPYRDVLEVIQDTGGLLGPKQLCAALGLAASDGAREAMRRKLLRLVERGWCMQPAPGKFGLAPGVSGRMP